MDSGWGLLAGAPIWLLGAFGVLSLLREQLRVELLRLRELRGRTQEIRRVIESVDERRIITAAQIPAQAQARFRPARPVATGQGES